ncbi:hypothetical protein [Streptomyces canus]|uniref:hypothetical protein n=1 Tax=Streptomyces canus TaxID=58343 RepID=UPI003F53EA4C
MADTPGALQLRLLQTVVDVSAERNSTLVMPFRVQMLRFFEHQSREADGESIHRSTPRPTLPERPERPEHHDLPELITSAPPAAPAFPLSGERAGSHGDRIGSRPAVARERRDNWPARADSDSDVSHAGG